MKNQGENKNRNKFDSYKFILFTGDLIGPLFIVSTPSLPLSVQGRGGGIESHNKFSKSGGA